MTRCFYCGEWIEDGGELRKVEFHSGIVEMPHCEGCPPKELEK